MVVVVWGSAARAWARQVAVLVALAVAAPLAAAPSAAAEDAGDGRERLAVAASADASLQSFVDDCPGASGPKGRQDRGDGTCPQGRRPRGGDALLTLGFTRHGTALVRQHALLRFDLPPAPEGMRLESALLRLTVAGDPSPDTDITLVTGAWDEATVNTFTQPPVADQPSGQAALEPGSVAFPVAAAAQAWLDDPDANFGLALIPSGDAPFETLIASREHPDTCPAGTRDCIPEAGPDAGPRLELVFIDDDAGEELPLDEGLQVSFSRPLDGALLWDEQPLGIDWVGGTPVSVEYLANGAAIGDGEGRALSMTWDTTEVPDGAYRLTAVATDADGETVAAAPIDVTVDQRGGSGDRLLADYLSGELSGEDYTRYGVYRWFDPERVPEQYRPPAAPEHLAEHLTVDMLYALWDFERIDPDVQRELLSFIGLEAAPQPAGEDEPEPQHADGERLDADIAESESAGDDATDQEAGGPEAPGQEPGGESDTEHPESSDDDEPEVDSSLEPDAVTMAGAASAAGFFAAPAVFAASPGKSGQAPGRNQTNWVDCQHQKQTTFFGVDLHCRRPLTLSHSSKTLNVDIYYTVRQLDGRILNPIDGLTDDDIDADLNPGRPNGVPDYVDRIAKALQLAYKTYIEMGYRNPGDDPLIHLTASGRLRIGIASQVQPVKGGELVDRGFSLPKLFQIFLPKDRPTPIAMTAHELFHQFQHQYLVGTELGAHLHENLPPTVQSWWLEATAEWATHKFFEANAIGSGDERIAYASRLPDFLGDPTAALTSFDNFDRKKPQYGAFIFAEYLQEHVANRDPDIIRQTWEAVFGGLGGIDLVIRGASGRRLDDIMADFHERNYNINSLARSYGSPDRQDWVQTLDSGATKGDALGGARPARAPGSPLRLREGATIPGKFDSLAPGGAGYVDITLPPGKAGRIRVTVEADAFGSNPGRFIDARVLTYGPAPQGYPNQCGLGAGGQSRYPIEFDGDTGTVTVDMSDSSSGQTRVCSHATLIISHVDPRRAQTSPFVSVHGAPVYFSATFEEAKALEAPFMHTGAVATLAGDGVRRNREGTGLDSSFEAMQGLAVIAGDVYVGAGRQVLRYSPLTGEVSRIAGGGSSPGNCIDSPIGRDLQFNTITSLFARDSDILMTTMASSCGVRRISPAGATTTLAAVTGPRAVVEAEDGRIFVAHGTQVSALVPNDSTAPNAPPLKPQLFATLEYSPQAMTVDDEALWVNIRGSVGTTRQIVRVDLATADVSPLIRNWDIGYGALLSAGDFLYGDAGYGALRRYSKADGAYIVVAGTMSPAPGDGVGYADGAGADAWFHLISGLATDGSSIFVGDNNLRLRRVQASAPLPTQDPVPAPVLLDVVVSTAAGDGQAATNGTSVNSPRGIAIVDTTMFISTNGSIRTLDLETGSLGILVGATGISGCVNSSDASQVGSSLAGHLVSDGYFLYSSCSSTIRRTSIRTGATSHVVDVTSPRGMAYFDGFLYVTTSDRVVRVDPTSSLMSHVATLPFPGHGIAADHDGLWIAVRGSHGSTRQVVHVDPATGTVSPFVTDWDIASQTLLSAGDYLYGDAGFGALRRYSKSDGTFLTIAGSLPTAGYADGPGPAARFRSFGDLATDGADVFVSDTGNNRIRRVSASG